MGLFLNNTGHWQISGGGELRSGDQVKVYWKDGWTTGEVKYQPNARYIIQLENGEEFPLCEELEVRIILNA